MMCVPGRKVKELLKMGRLGRVIGAAASLMTIPRLTKAAPNARVGTTIAVTILLSDRSSAR